MHIAIFTDSYLPYISGATFAVLNQSNELAARGHRVDIYCPRVRKRFAETLRREVHPNIRVYSVDLSIPYNTIPNFSVAFPVFLPSYRRLRQSPPDVIHVHTEWGCGWEGLLLGKWLKCPVVGTFHTMWGDPRYLENFPFPKGERTQKMMWGYSSFFYRHCDRVIAPSKTVAEHLIRHRVASDPVQLANGVPLPLEPRFEKLEDARAALRRDGRLTFVYIGRLAPEKSHAVMMGAFKRVNQAFPNSRLRIIGDGPGRAEVESAIRSLDLQGHVELVGLVDHKTLIEEKIATSGDVFVTSSETENQPISILEAMAFGLPIIGPSARGIPELVAHQVNGLLFTPGDINEMAFYMERMLREPLMRLRMGEASFTRARKYAIQNIVTDLELVYESCLAPSRQTLPIPQT